MNEEKINRNWTEVNRKRRNLIANGWQFVKIQVIPHGNVKTDLFQRDDQQCYFLWSSGNIIEVN